MNKKYQIFISSTYEDLKSERQQTIKAILEMGHIPVGMEMFSAGDESQWELIKRQIDDCDYYVVIAAHRYGSMDGSISYTEKEYNYAVEKSIPVLAFLLNDKARWPKSKIDMDPVVVSSLAQFKERLKTRIIDYWSSAPDLKSKVSIALMKQMNLNPRIGWMKANQISEPDVLNEISRLSKENAELRKNLVNHQHTEEVKMEEQAERVEKLLEINKISISFFYGDGTDWENPKTFSYSRIFSLLAPELQTGKSTNAVCGFLGRLLNPDITRIIRTSFPAPSNTIKTILTDFTLLKLTEVRRPQADEGEIWGITSFGSEIYARGRLKLLERNYPKDTLPETPSNGA